MLKLENVQSGYGNILAVKGISLEVNQGEIITLIGANGAGKSTTIRMLCGILEPTSGNATVMTTKVSQSQTFLTKR